MDHRSAVRRRLPAFGRDIVRLRKSGYAPDSRGIVIVDDWDRWPNYQWRVVVQKGEEVDLLDFSFVAGLEVIIMCGNEDACDRIGAAVANFNPNRIIGVSINPPKIIGIVCPPLEL